MTWDGSQYVKLLIWRPDKGPDRWLIALRTTADYYGWTEQFPRWTPKIVSGSGKYAWCMDPGRRGEMFCESGRKQVICRAASRHGNPARMTNQFKVSASCRLFDLAEVAALTNVDWHWMSAPNGERLSREHWLSLYEAGPRRGRGAVFV